MKKMGKKNTKPWKMFENDIAVKATLESAAVSKVPVVAVGFRSRPWLEGFFWEVRASTDFSTSGASSVGDVRAFKSGSIGPTRTNCYVMLTSER
jgi:hypothetical protein